MSVNKYDPSTGTLTPVAGDPIQANKSNSEAIAPLFDATETYSAGDLVMKDGKLYSFKNAHTGAWSASDVDETDINEKISELKNSVGDGKALLAGAITDEGVTTSASASFQTMANNIGDILDANPGSVTSSVSIPDKSSGGYSDSFIVSAPMSLNEGYIKIKGTEGTETVKLDASGRSVIATDSNSQKVYGVKSVASGSVSSSASFNSGTSTTVTAKSSMTLSEGYISSKGTEGTKTAYLRRDSNDVYLSSSSSGGTNYGKYSIPTETKEQIAGTSNVVVTPSSGKLLTNVTVKPTPSESKDPTPTLGTQTIVPSSGKLLSSVKVYPAGKTLGIKNLKSPSFTVSTVVNYTVSCYYWNGSYDGISDVKSCQTYNNVSIGDKWGYRFNANIFGSTDSFLSRIYIARIIAFTPGGRNNPVETWCAFHAGFLYKQGYNSEVINNTAITLPNGTLQVKIKAPYSTMSDLIFEASNNLSTPINIAVILY